MGFFFSAPPKPCLMRVLVTMFQLLNLKVSASVHSVLLPYGVQQKLFKKLNPPTLLLKVFFFKTPPTIGIKAGFFFLVQKKGPPKD